MTALWDVNTAAGPVVGPDSFNGSVEERIEADCGVAMTEAVLNPCATSTKGL